MRFRPSRWRKTRKRLEELEKREKELYELTGWDLESLNEALRAKHSQIATTKEVREAIHNMAISSGYPLTSITELFNSVWRKK